MDLIGGGNFLGDDFGIHTARIGAIICERFKLFYVRFVPHLLVGLHALVAVFRFGCPKYV